MLNPNNNHHHQNNYILQGMLNTKTPPLGSFGELSFDKMGTYCIHYIL